jgi:RNA polymerase sigma-70 factor (ECF subfamily)
MFRSFGVEGEKPMVAARIKPSLLADLTDRDLLDRAVTGDQDAFAVLVHRYQEELYQFARRHVGSEEAQDIVQLTLLQLYLSLARLQRASIETLRPLLLRAWLYRVAWNRCIDISRKNKPQYSLQETFDDITENDGGELVFALADPSPTPQEQLEQAEERSELQVAIQSLPPQFRRIVWLRYTEEQSFKDIAYQLHIPMNTAKTYYYRGCRRLRTNFAHQTA